MSLVTDVCVCVCQMAQLPGRLRRRAAEDVDARGHPVDCCAAAHGEAQC